MAVEVEWVASEDTGSPVMQEKTGSEFEMEVDLVFLALGFVSPEHSGLLDELGVSYDEKGNVSTDNQHMTMRCGLSFGRIAPTTIPSFQLKMPVMNKIGQAGLP